MSVTYPVDAFVKSQVSGNLVRTVFCFDGGGAGFDVAGLFGFVDPTGYRVKVPGIFGVVVPTGYRVQVPGVLGVVIPTVNAHLVVLVVSAFSHSVVTVVEDVLYGVTVVRAS